MFFTWLIIQLVATLHHTPPVPTYPAPVISPDMLERVKHETVLISNEGWEGVSRGTGVLIDSTHVLTCAHMIESKAQPWIYTYPLGRIHLGTHIVLYDQTHDVAIIEIQPGVNLAHYAVFNTTTTIGQPVVVVGNTLGSMSWFVSYGIISEKWDFYNLTTATIHGGNSGGPWVNLNGQIVALTDWGLQNRKGQDEGISGGINGETLIGDIEAFRHPKSFIDIIMGN